MNITITPTADKFMRRMVRFGGPAGSGFRLTVAPGGCSGLAAEFNVEPKPQEGDTTIEHNGMKIFLPAASCALLEGYTIDFADTISETGLVFRHPQASSCCSSAAPKELVGLTNFKS